MSTLSQFAFSAATTSIVNSASSGGTSVANIHAQATVNNAREVLSGAVTANALATALSVTGGGEVPYLSAYTKDTTSRTVRVKVTVDGVVAFDATSSTVTTTNAGVLVVGMATFTNYITQAPAPLRFNSSLLVQIASSLSETDKVAIAYVLNKR